MIIEWLWVAVLVACVKMPELLIVAVSTKNVARVEVLRRPPEPTVRLFKRLPAFAGKLEVVVFREYVEFLTVKVVRVLIAPL
jgi:hypothetical protein